VFSNWKRRYEDQGKISRTDTVLRNRFMEKPSHYIVCGTDICSNLTNGLSREWLVTYGIGGYTSGTIAGLLYCSYHGILTAASKPPVSWRLLLSKLDETVFVKDQKYPLYSNILSEGAIEGDRFTCLY